MKALLATPFADSRAADLSLAHGLGRLPALGKHRVELPGAGVELRVLGASHQVVAELESGPWSETVACLPGAGAALPARHEASAGGLRVRFCARRQRLPPTALAGRVRAVCRRCADDPDALVATFPGSPLAVTALLVRAEPGGGTRWWSWHAYPQAGELVTTSSVVRPQ